MEGSTVSGSGGIGVSVSNGDLEMKGSEVELNNGGGVMFSAGNGVFWNNIIANNVSGSGVFGGMRLDPLGGMIEFWNNTVAGNFVNGQPSAVVCIGTVALHNSVFSGTGELLSSSCEPEYSYIGDGSGGGAKTGCIETGEAVEYVDPGSYDYHLQATSPCIDQGTSTGMPAGLTVDIDGENRVQGGGVDMGADEAQ